VMSAPMELDRSHQGNPDEDHSPGNQAIGLATGRIKTILDGLKSKDRISVLRAVSGIYGMNISFLQSAFGPGRRSVPNPNPEPRSSGQRVKKPKVPQVPQDFSGPLGSVKRIQSEIATINVEISETSQKMGGQRLPDDHQLLVRRGDLFRLLSEAKIEVAHRATPQTSA